MIAIHRFIQSYPEASILISIIILISIWIVGLLSLAMWPIAAALFVSTGPFYIIARAGQYAGGENE